MNDLNNIDGVWFIYDGECPICSRAAETIAIKEKFGALYTIDARENDDSLLMQEINLRRLDLDEGMVIYTQGEFYHGKEALNFIAKHGTPKNTFMLITKGLFWSKILSSLMYPWIRSVRNDLLSLKKSSRIDNLNLKKEPIFKSIFGSDWDSLPIVMKKHYANRPYSTEVTTIKGTLNIFCKAPLLWFAPMLKLLGQIPAFNQSGVPVTVRFESEPNSKLFHFNRKFDISGREPYFFRSKMIQTRGNEVIEIMKFGLGWRMQCSWNGQQVVLKHKGYVIYLFGHFIPIPLTILMGEANAIETPVCENIFDMEVNITHPWWGEMYGYNGRFEAIN